MRRVPLMVRPDFDSVARLASRRRRLHGLAGLVLLSLAAGSAPCAWAAPPADDGHGAAAGRPQILAQSDTERALFQRLVCMCPTCARPRLADCGCGFAQQERARISRMVLEQHMTEQQVVDALVAEYGQAVLGAPVSGVSGHVWLILYGLGGLAIGAVIIVAVRWTRGRAEPDAAPATPGAPPTATTPTTGAERYEQRLDDELREIE
jgi:cytochrome c-type biogenesis protein CcmH/NrfF